MVVLRSTSGGPRNLFRLFRDVLMEIIGANRTLQNPPSFEESQRFKRMNVKVIHHKFNIQDNPMVGYQRNKQRLKILLVGRQNSGV